MVRRPLAHPARPPSSPFLSNCQQNGAEFAEKCQATPERARFELYVADLVMKHLDKLKASGALPIEDSSEAAKKFREQMFGKYTKEQIEAAKLASS